jgi:hypothetical protein
MKLVTRNRFEADEGVPAHTSYHYEDGEWAVWFMVYSKHPHLSGGDVYHKGYGVLPGGSTFNWPGDNLWTVKRQALAELARRVTPQPTQETS